jgi:hypothetical protein
MAEASLFLVVKLTDIQAMRSRGLAPGRLDRLLMAREFRPQSVAGSLCGCPATDED